MSAKKNGELSCRDAPTRDEIAARAGLAARQLASRSMSPSTTKRMKSRSVEVMLAHDSTARRRAASHCEAAVFIVHRCPSRGANVAMSRTFAQSFNLFRAVRDDLIFFVRPAYPSCLRGYGSEVSVRR
jgi:hypothetical protein